MLRNLLTKDLWDHRRSMLWWVVGMAAMTGLLAAFYPVVRDSSELQDFLTRLPAEVLALFGINPEIFTTGAGYLTGQLYSFVGPIIVIAFCVITGSAATAREEAHGSMDILLAAPVGRSNVVFQKAASMMVMAFVIVATIAVVLLALNTPIGLMLNVEGIVAVSVGLWLLGVTFGAVAMLVGAFTGSPGLASGFGAGLALAAFVVNAFSDLFSWLELPSMLSPFSWYTDNLPLVSGVSSGLVWLGLLSLSLIVVASLLFRRRDIATSRPVLPERKAQTRPVRSIEPRSVWLLGSVFRKTVWDRRRSVWAWAVGLSSLTLLTFAAWPALTSDPQALADLVGAIPSEMLALFGFSDPEALATPQGFVSSRTYGSVGPIVIIVFGIGAMTSYAAREEKTGVLDEVVSNPQSRRSVLAGKAIGVVALIGVIVTFLFLVALIGNAVWETEMDPLQIAAANVGLGLLGLCFFGIALTVWSLLGASGPAVGVTAAIAVVAYFLNGLGAAIDVIEPLRVASPFFWYLGDTVPLAKGFTTGYLALAAVAVAGVVLATLRFRTRDLAV